MRTVNCTILSANDSISQISDKIDSGQLIAASFFAYFDDATAAGTFTIEGSNDICNSSNLSASFTPTHWCEIPSANATVTSGTSAILLLKQVAFRWLRAKYVVSSGGSSNITVIMSALSM